jgi:hypothetical protein
MRLLHIVAGTIAGSLLVISVLWLLHLHAKDELLGLWVIDAAGLDQMPAQLPVKDAQLAKLIDSEVLRLKPADNVHARSDLATLLNDYGLAPEHVADVADRYNLGADAMVPDYPIEIRLENPGSRGSARNREEGPP